MSSRIFQSVVLQMKDSTERAIGVIDSEGTVVACNELSCIGEHWPGAVEAVNRGEGDAVRFDGRTFKALAGWGAQFDYAAFVQGEDEMAGSLTRPPLSRTSSPTTFCWGTSMSAPRSCTLSPRRPGRCS